jgi:hypothetical protein
MRPTRFYSNRQEKQVAKAVGGRKTANSGATPFVKGDVLADDWLIECKCHTEHRSSMSVKEDWIYKNREEAFQMGKHHSAVAIQFEPDGENHYIISEIDFKEYMDYLRDITREVDDGK